MIFLDPNFNFNEYDIPNLNIETTYFNYDFTEKAPDFIYDETSRKKYNLKIKKGTSTLYCINVKKKLPYLLLG